MHILHTRLEGSRSGATYPDRDLYVYRTLLGLLTPDRVSSRSGFVCFTYLPSRFSAGSKPRSSMWMILSPILSYDYLTISPTHSVGVTSFPKDIPAKHAKTGRQDFVGLGITSFPQDMPAKYAKIPRRIGYCIFCMARQKNGACQPRGYSDTTELHPHPPISYPRHPASHPTIREPGR